MRWLLVALVLLVVFYCAARYAGGGPGADGFYTAAAHEPATRPWAPWVGSEPAGAWGVKPWAYS